MTAMPPEQPQSEQKWWVSENGTPTGPHSESYVLVGLKTGTISAQTFVCPAGGQEWKRVTEWPPFSSACPLSPPPPMPVAPPSGMSAAWNPRAIGWLGLLFSPLWSGVMAAINAHQLQSGTPVWRPVLIAVGATIISVLVELLLFESYILTLLLYFLAVWGIWHLDLQSQVPLFDSRLAGGFVPAKWTVPSVAGFPAALVVVFMFLIAPLLPIEPREVCQRFLAASSLKEAKKYTTTKLWPALEALDKMEDNSSFKGRVDLTYENAAQDGTGGRLVGWRIYEEEGKNRHVTEGFFHVVNYDGSWKIEEWYFTSRDGEQIPQPVAMSMAYPEMIRSIQQEQQAKASTAKTPGAKQENPFKGSHPISKAFAFVYDMFGLWGVVVAIAFVLICGWAVSANKQ